MNCLLHHKKRLKTMKSSIKEVINQKYMSDSNFNGQPEDRSLQCKPVTLGDQIILPPYSFQVVEL